MTYTVIISPSAKKDLDAAFVWYEGQREGLGFEFLTCFDAVAQKLKRNPTYAGFIYKQVRGVALNRFPYEVLFITDETFVSVIAVIHHSRSPEVRKGKYAE